MEQKLTASLSPMTIDELGQEASLVERLCTVRPDRLVLALLVSRAVGRVASLADVTRTFCALTGAKLRYKPLHSQLVEFPKRPNNAML